MGTDTYVNGGPGADTITLGFGTWAGYNGGGGSAAKTVYGGGGAGAGADTLILAGATITNSVTGDDEAETFMLLGGTVGGNVNGGAGADAITIDGATVTGYLRYASDDIVTLTSGSLGELRGTNGNDAIIIDGSADAEGGTLKIADTFTPDFIDLRDGADILTLKSGTWASYSGGEKSGTPTGGAIYGGRGADTLILKGATISGNILGDGEADTITLLSGDVGTETFVNGGSGADTITLGFGTWAGYNSGGGSEAGTVYGGGGGGADTLILEGAEITGNILGDGEADTITLTSGTVGTDTYVHGSGGADTITLGFETWAGYSGGGGSDAKTVYGGGGADTLILKGATITGNILGDEEADTITLTSGTVGVGTYVNAGGGVDTITLGFETWAGYEGGEGNRVKTVYGGGGRDTLILDGATITGDITGDAEAEVFTLISGTIGGSLDAGRGNDTINLNGDVIMETGTIDGGGGTDTLNYNGGRIIMADGTERTDEAVADTSDLFRQIETCTGAFPAAPSGCTGDSTIRAAAGARGFARQAFSPDLSLRGEVPEDSEREVFSPDLSLAGEVGQDSEREVFSPELVTAGIPRGFERLSFSPTLSLAGVLPSALQDFTSAAASFLAASPQKRSGLWVREEETQSLRAGGMRLARLQSLEAEGSYGAKIDLAQQGYDKPLRESGLTLRSFMHLAKGEVAAEALTGKANIQRLWRRRGSLVAGRKRLRANGGACCTV